MKKLAVKISLKGINAVAGGMIVAAALSLMQASGFTWLHVAVTAATVALLASEKIPAPLIVVVVLLAGMVIVTDRLFSSGLIERVSSCNLSLIRWFSLLHEKIITGLSGLLS